MIDQQKFWELNPATGKVNIKTVDLYKGFLTERGFRKKTIDGEKEIYRLNDYVISEEHISTKINSISDFFLKEKKDLKEEITIEHARKDDETFTYTSKDLLESFIKYGWNKIFSDHNLNHLEELTVPVLRHSRNAAYFYFQNGFVEVTRHGATHKQYSEMPGQYIYKDVIIPRNISILDTDDPSIQKFAHRGYQFYDFLNRICGVPENAFMASIDNTNKLKYLMQCLGYLLHDYKQKGLTDFAVVFCDDDMGGSGKGILIQALSQMTKVTEIDCKKEDQYDPASLSSRTRIKVYGDVESGFNFRRIYNEITEPALIRVMYKSPYYVPYLDSWKTAITANHIIRGITDADLRRQRVFSMVSYFNKSYTPMMRYKHSFFSEDWQEMDWNYFYSLMFACAQAWLDADYHLNFNDTDYVERKLEEEYPFEFREYVDKLLAEVKTQGTQHIVFSDFYYQFKENDRYRLNPFVRKLTPGFFSRLLKKYLDQQPEFSWSKNHNRTQISVWMK